MSTRTKQTAYTLGFCYMPVPEEVELNEDGQPKCFEDATQASIQIAVIPPFLSVAFTTDNDGPPSISDMFMCVREAWRASSANATLDEAYGLFLDGLKKAIDHPFLLGEEKIDFPEDFPEDMKAIAGKTCGQVMVINKNFVCLRLLKHELFSIKS